MNIRPTFAVLFIFFVIFAIFFKILNFFAKKYLKIFNNSLIRYHFENEKKKITELCELTLLTKVLPKFLMI